MGALKFRMYLLLAVLFAVIYAAIALIGTSLGVGNFYFYLLLSFGLMFFQYMVGPDIIEWSMEIRYVDEKKYPKLHQMVADLAAKAGIPKPRVGIVRNPLPNAFAFGRGFSDGRICVTDSLLPLLSDEELRAVLGHEMTHLKNRDVLTITILSVIPMILYRMAWHFLWLGGERKREHSSQSAALLGLAAFLFYFVTNLLVLYGSRIREYFADQGSVALGNPPSALASALYKLVYGSARMNRETLKDMEGIKAFFVNDPSRSALEIKELKEIDADRNGIIDARELEVLRKKEIRLKFYDRLFEILSTHPNMLKRIKRLSSDEAAHG